MKAYAGFTLIEVLLATLLSAMLGIILFTAYNQVNRITRSIDDYVDVYSKEALLQNLLSRDISGAFIPIQAQATANSKEKLLEHIFVYEPEAEATRFKSFTFITNNPTAVYGSAKPRIARVRYTLKEEKGVQASPPSYTLFRQESDTLDINEFTKTGSPIRAYEVVSGIKKIVFTFTRMIKKEEKFEPEVRPVWQSEVKKEQEKNEQQQQEIVLPQLVNFTITLWDNEKKREREFFGSVLIATMLDAQVQEPEEETKKRVTSPSKEQQSSQQPAPREEPKNSERIRQEAMVPRQKQREIIVVQERGTTKQMRQRSPTLISQMSPGDNHAT